MTTLAKAQPTTHDVFLSAAIRTEFIRNYNDQVIRALENIGLSVYAPQRELPVGTEVSATEILHANTGGVTNSRVTVAVLIDPGHGVFYELGVATVDQKDVFVLVPEVPENSFRIPTSPETYDELIVRDWYNSVPADRRVSSIEALVESIRSYLASGR